MHTYLATCGRTLAGKHQEHKEDVNEDGSAGGPRQAPMVVNDFSAGQPHCDKSNRWRQRVLAIEERMLTKSFPLRFATTGLGIMLVNTWSAWDYFIQNGKGGTAGGLTFRACMKALCAEGLRCDLDRNDPQFGPSHTPAKTAHDIVPLKTIVGRTGSRTPRCAHCSFQCSTVCLQCSSAASLVVCYPVETIYKRKLTRHACLGLHMRFPESSRRATASASKSAAAKRKHRARKAEAGGGSDEDDDDGLPDDYDEDEESPDE